MISSCIRKFFIDDVRNRDKNKRQHSNLKLEQIKKKKQNQPLTEEQ